MRFDELPLLSAILAVRDEMEAKGESSGADKWIVDGEGRRDLTHRVMQEMIGDADQKIIDAWHKFRKGGTVDGGGKKNEVLVLVYRNHGGKCFYANRGLGACSDEVHLDRILPDSRGGKYTVNNCVLACSTHNTMRGDKSIEDFLSESVETPY